MVAILAAAALGIGASALMLSLWSDLRPASAEEAERAFDAAVAEAGGGPAYLEVSGGGEVLVRRDLERPRPASLRTLHLLAWEPGRARLLRIDFPFWFVRMKMSDTLNLGTLTAALARDWDSLDLSVAERDLERRGPGLVLDQRRPDGARLLLWTE